MGFFWNVKNTTNLFFLFEMKNTTTIQLWWTNHYKKKNQASRDDYQVMTPNCCRRGNFLTARIGIIIGVLSIFQIWMTCPKARSKCWQLLWFGSQFDYSECQGSMGFHVQKCRLLSFTNWVVFDTTNSENFKGTNHIRFIMRVMFSVWLPCRLGS